MKNIGFILLYLCVNSAFAQTTKIKSESVTISTSKVNNAKCTLKEYDENGNLTLTRNYHYTGDSALNKSDTVWREYVYAYDENNNVANKSGFENKTITEINISSKYNGKKKTSSDIEYLKGTEKHVFKINFTYNTAGLVAKEVYSSAGKEYKTIEYEYNSNKQLTRKIIKVKGDKEIKTYDYTPLGLPKIMGLQRVNSRNEYYATDTLSCRWVYIKKTEKLQGMLWNLANKEEYQALYTYEGDLVAQIQINNWKRVQRSRMEFEYFENGMIKRKLVYDADDVLVATYDYVYTFYP